MAKKIQLLDIPKAPKPYPSQRTAMGRAVQHHSPDKHPEQRDALGRQPDIAGTDSYPTRGGIGSESYTTAQTRRGRLAKLGK